MTEETIQQIRRDVEDKLIERYGSNWHVLTFEVSTMTMGGTASIHLTYRTDFQGRELRAGAIKRSINEVFEATDRFIEEQKKEVINERVQLQEA
jgi:hypothetical protein